MPDSRFYLTAEPITPEAAAALGGGVLAASRAHFDAGAASVVRTDTAHADDLRGAAVFLESLPVERQLLDVAAAGRGPALCFADEATAQRIAEMVPTAISARPKAALALVSAHLHRSRQEDDPLALYGPIERTPLAGDTSARISATARVDPTARIALTARIADGVSIGPNAVIGYGVEIGPDSRIGPNVVISHAIIGARVTLSAGVVVGEAGFGYAEGETGVTPIPQLGVVDIRNDVEIGANTCVDRAAFGATVIGEGSKIDNLVQIGHNVQIGRSCMVAGQTALAGGAVLEDGVMIGGQSGVGNNVVMGTGSQLGALSGAMRNVPAGETWGGVPAVPTHLWWRSVMFLHKSAKAGGRKPTESSQSGQDEAKTTKSGAP
ncbi:MAG: UDP-3-O-(3-hydroxymyristoyl)glucosamine N-acyltransferase [Pseudomonadota bacterium]